MNLVNSNRKELISYVKNQLNHFFPDRQSNIEHILDLHIDEALDRLEVCINAVRMWRIGEFDYLHSSQYTIFLYFLSNTIFRHNGDIRICTKIFFLNKSLNGIDCFYEIEMPSIFFIGHSVGIVLAKATYGNYLAIYQNSTVGKNHGEAPIIGEHVLLYPNSAVIGKSIVADRSVISQGTSVVNRNTKENSLVFTSEGGELVFRAQKKPIIEEVFRY